MSLSRRAFLGSTALAAAGLGGLAAAAEPRPPASETRGHQPYAFALNGPLVPILPALDEAGRLDHDAVCGWIDALIGRGIRLFWTTHGTTHFMCMTDEEIADLTRAIARVTRGRAGFIASTAYHWPVERCIRFVEECGAWGVDAVKLQVDWRLWAPRHEAFLAFYRRIADVSPVPLLAYTYGQPGVTPALLEKVLEMPRFIGMKNDSGDFYEETWYLRTVRRTTDRPFQVMTGGTLESALHAWHFGMRSYAVGLAVFAPAPAVKFHALLEAGDFAGAAAVVRDIEQPVFGEFQRMGPRSHWACMHAALHLQGYFKTPAMRFPLASPTAEQIQRTREILQAHAMLA